MTKAKTTTALITLTSDDIAAARNIAGELSKSTTLRQHAADALVALAGNGDKSRVDAIGRIVQPEYVARRIATQDGLSLAKARHTANSIMAKKQRTTKNAGDAGVRTAEEEAICAAARKLWQRVREDSGLKPVVTRKPKPEAKPIAPIAPTTSTPEGFIAMPAIAKPKGKVDAYEGLAAMLTSLEALISDHAFDGEAKLRSSFKTLQEVAAARTRAVSQHANK